MATWHPIGNGQTHCIVHDQTFTTGVETCSYCKSAPRSVIAVSDETDRSDFDKERLLVAEESRSLAKYLEAHGRALIDGWRDDQGEWQDAKASDRKDAYKAFEIVAKLNRLAIEAAQPVNVHDHQRRLARDVKKIKGVQ